MDESILERLAVIEQKLDNAAHERDELGSTLMRVLDQIRSDSDNQKKNRRTDIPAASLFRAYSLARKPGTGA